MMSSSANIDNDLMAAAAAVTANMDTDLMEATSATGTSTPGIRVENIFSSISPVKSRPQSPLDIEVPFHDDTALEGAVNMDVLENDEDDVVPKKDKKAKKGGKSGPKTLHVDLHNMKLGGGCVTNAGRIDLNKLKSYCPVLFRGAKSSVRLGRREPVNEVNPLRIQAEKKKNANAKQANKAKKEVKKAPAKKLDYLSSSDGSDSDLEEMKKKLGVKTPAANKPATALAGLLSGSASANKPPPKRELKVKKRDSSSEEESSKARRSSTDKVKKKKKVLQTPRSPSSSPKRSGTAKQRRSRSSSRGSVRSRRSYFSSSSRSSSVRRSPVSSRSSSVRSRTRSRSLTRSRSRSKSPAAAPPSKPAAASQDGAPKKSASFQSKAALKSFDDHDSKAKKETEIKKNPLFSAKGKSDEGGGSGKEKEKEKVSNGGDTGTKSESKSGEKAEKKVIETKSEEKSENNGLTAEERSSLEADLAKDFGGSDDKQNATSVKKEITTSQPTKKEVVSVSEENKTTAPVPVTVKKEDAEAVKKEEKSGPKVDPNIFGLSKDMRFFRDILKVEIDPNPDFLRAGGNTTVGEFEKIVKKVLDNLDRPANQKPNFVPAKGLGPPPSIGDVEKVLFERHHIKKACKIKLRDVSVKEKYQKALKLAKKNYIEGQKDSLRRRKDRVTRGLQAVKDSTSSKHEGKKKRPILDSSDSEDDRKENRHRHYDKHKHKDKDKDRDRSKDKHRDKHRDRERDKKDSGEKKLSFT